MQTLRGKKNKIVVSVLNVSNESGREESVTSLTFVPQKKDIIWSKKKKKKSSHSSILAEVLHSLYTSLCDEGEDQRIHVVIDHLLQKLLLCHLLSSSHARSPFKLSLCSI